MSTLSRSTTYSLLAGLLASGALAHAAPLAERQIVSPSGKLSLSFRLTPDGQPAYALSLGPKPVLRESRLGIVLAEGPGLTGGFVLDSAEEKLVDATWEPVWGEERRIRDNHRELLLVLRQPSAKDRKLVLRFRLFDDGLGFRYEVPRQDGVDYLVVSDERTEFALTGDHKAFWIPGDYDSNEYAYVTTPLSKVDASIGARVAGIAVQTFAGPDVVQTPLMLKSADGLYVNIHEAAQVGYPALMLKVDGTGFVLSSHLVPDAVGNKAYLQTPCQTPWRTVVVSERATEILASRLILNLNEPSQIADTSWIKPRKYVGIWWAMHVGTASWNYSDTPNVKLADTDWLAMKPNGRHGATTAETKRYVDFAAKHGLDARARRGLERGLGGLVRPLEGGGVRLRDTLSRLRRRGAARIRQEPQRRADHAPRDLGVGDELRAPPGRRPSLHEGQRLRRREDGLRRADHPARRAPRRRLDGPATSCASPRRPPASGSWWTCTSRCVPAGCIAPSRTGWPARRRAATSTTPGATATRPSTRRSCPSRA